MSDQAQIDDQLLRLSDRDSGHIRVAGLSG